MPASYDKVILHAVWSTKYRLPQIDGRIEESLHKIIAQLFKDQGCLIYAVNGTYDHVHAVFSLPRTKTVASIMNAVKSKSSGWVHKRRGEYEAFAWQDGYGVFSVDYRKKEEIINYVRRQKEHHNLLPTTSPDAMNWTFREEFTRFLQVFGHADFPEKYVFPDPPKQKSDSDNTLTILSDILTPFGEKNSTPPRPLPF